MSNYDLAVLNDKDFEMLVADLLSAEFGVLIERFKAGKDSGVDLRWYSSPSREVIVQCKHWCEASFAAILRHIVKSEKVKVDVLKPIRYLFVCSIPLSRANKAAITAAFSPHIKSDSDVIGLEDLNDIISRHKEIERRHYKLWMSSTNVLTSLLNNGVIGRSDDAIQEIKSTLLKYVETEDSCRARERLERDSIVIIKGEPGIGKTTLAQQLVMESVADGFQLVKIERDINEAEDVFDVAKKQIFYFDDFLGRNFLEVLSDNKDSHIVGFVKRVARNQNKRFVLTTRTHILDRSKQLTELFNKENIGNREFELKIGGLSRFERSKILYSHLWTSDLPLWVIDEVYQENRYLEVVDHQNFNPRLISFITNAERLVDIEPGRFWNYVVETLENPEAIWRHVFERQLGQDARDIAILVAFNGKSIDQPSLELAFRRLNSVSGDNYVQLSHRFNQGLRAGVGSVLNRSVGTVKSPSCSLFNPSIADYLLKDEVASSRIVEIVLTLRTVDSINYLSSLVREGYLSRESLDDALVRLAIDLQNENIISGRFAIRVCELILDSEIRDKKCNFCTLVANQIIPEEIENDTGMLRVFAETLYADNLIEADIKFNKILDVFDNLYHDEDQMTVLHNCAKYIDNVYGSSLALILREKMISMWTENAHYVISDSAILDNFYDDDIISEARDVVRDYIVETFSNIGFQLTGLEISKFINSVDFRDIFSDNLASAAKHHKNDSNDSSPSIEDAVIIDYFDRAISGDFN